MDDLRNPSVGSVVSMGFGTLQSFELMQRAAKLLANSTLVPPAYRFFIEERNGGFKENHAALSNCVVALNMSQRMGADPLMVMQNLYIVEGRPAWSSQYIIAAINNCGRYSPLRFDLSEPGPEQEVEYQVVEWRRPSPNTKAERTVITKKIKIRNQTCRAWAIEKETKERLESPVVSIEMAVKEGWFGKNGSKWQTMQEVMLRYRAASFFGKIYAPELLMGLQTAEEAADIIDIVEEPRVSPVPVETLKEASPDPAPPEETPEQPEEPDAPNPPKPAEGPTVSDAIQAARKGDYELARDMARTFSEEERAQIDAVIDEHQQQIGSKKR